MTSRLDIFGLEETAPTINPYYHLGYPRNPFREPSDEEAEGLPFYTGHIREQLRQIQQWVTEVHVQGLWAPLSLVGTIGTGKTRILKVLERALSNWSKDEKVLIRRLRLSDTGYSRASIGAMLMAALQEAQLGRSAPEGVLPLVWAVISASGSPRGHDILTQALNRAHSRPEPERTELATLVTRWLQRTTLTPAQAGRTGLSTRIDWEGEWIPVLSALLRAARDVGVLQTFFLLVDQLEDLLRDTFSELRRSRLLTDIRGLIDEISSGTPIGLLLAWTPDFGTVPGSARGNDVEALLKSRYEALYSRMRARRVDLPLLTRDDATPFAKEWVDSLEGQPGFDRALQPDLEEVVRAAWESLGHKRILFPGGGGRATPRDLLTELADQVEQRARHP